MKTSFRICASEAGATIIDQAILCFCLVIVAVAGLQAMGPRLRSDYAVVAFELGGGSADSMRNDTGDPTPFQPAAPGFECDQTGEC